MNELKYNKEAAYDLEFKFNHLFELWKSLMGVIRQNRKSLVQAIDLLRIDNNKINILLNMDIFKNNKSILLLEDAILTKLEEWIINERKFDNIYNILMCNYRKMEAHNKQLLTECLLKNGYMPKWGYFTVDD